MAEETAESLRTLLRLETARAEEAERNAARADEQSAAMIASLDTERAARLRAEGEREAWRTALRSHFADCPDDPEMAGTVLGAYVRTTDSANESLRERLAAAEAEVKRLREITDRRYDYRWPDPDTGEVLADPWLTAEECIAKYRASDAALRARAQRLVEAGDEMDGCRDDLRQRCTSCHDKWEAAKADAPAKEQ